MTACLTEFFVNKAPNANKPPIIFRHHLNRHCTKSGLVNWKKCQAGGWASSHSTKFELHPSLFHTKLRPHTHGTAHSLIPLGSGASPHQVYLLPLRYSLSSKPLTFPLPHLTSPTSTFPPPSAALTRSRVPQSRFGPSPRHLPLPPGLAHCPEPRPCSPGVSFLPTPSLLTPPCPPPTTTTHNPSSNLTKLLPREPPPARRPAWLYPLKSWTIWSAPFTRDAVSRYVFPFSPACARCSFFRSWLAPRATCTHQGPVRLTLRLSFAAKNCPGCAQPGMNDSLGRRNGRRPTSINPVSSSRKIPMRGSWSTRSSPMRNTPRPSVRPPLLLVAFWLYGTAYVRPGEDRLADSF